jgi:hypothetical protein
MESEVEVVARGAIQAINERTSQARAQELLDPSFVRYDLAQLLPDSHGPTGGSDFLGMILADHRSVANVRWVGLLPPSWIPELNR